MSEEDVLAKMPVSVFVEQLNEQRQLKLTQQQTQAAIKTLQDQWFSYASELKFVDQQAFKYLELPPSLAAAIHMVFSANSSPNFKFDANAAMTAYSRHSSDGKPDDHKHSPTPHAAAHSPHTDDDEDRVSEGGHGPAQPKRRGSLTALNKAVDHVLENNAGNQYLVGTLKKVLRSGMQQSDKMTQSVLRGHLKKLERESGKGGAAAHGRELGADDADNGADDGVDEKEEHQDAEPEHEPLPEPDHDDESESEAEVPQAREGKHRAADDDKDDDAKDEDDDGSDDDAAVVAGPAHGSHGASAAHAHAPAVSAPNGVHSNSTASSSPTSASTAAAALDTSSAAGGGNCPLCSKEGASRHSPPFPLDCSHTFCRNCLHDYLMDLVGQKKAVGMQCPWKGCGKEIDIGKIQKLLNAEEFESYLQATLLAFIEQDNLTFVCPNQKCKSVISVQPVGHLEPPHPITEKDDDGKVLTKEGWLHFQEFRVRCRQCQTVFCANCKVIPYHKGYTCAQFVDYQKARHCRFCSTRLDDKNTLGDAPSVALRDVCVQEECAAKRALSCTKMLSCGCPCGGVRDEPECLQCLKHELKIAEEFCPICYVESLREAPCVRSNGTSNNCNHTFHFACVKTKLEAKWPGARISFEFRTCPVCKKNLENPALTPILAPILNLEAVIQDKALQRLKYEGQEKNAAIVNPSGRFYNDPLGFAMHQFLFFLCWQCKKPYFAGGYQCQEANTPFDPKELMCPACQPSSVQDCEKHGKDWLVFKCRYCCNIANWFCWGNTHFCTACHKSGVWQKLAVFRTGKNKKKLWEYQNCTGMMKQIEEVKRRRELNDDQKEKEIEKLLADPKMCPLNVKHPPSGFEFGLGCSMCEDKKEVARAEVETANRHKLDGIREELKKSGGRVFVFDHDLDENGIFHFLGTIGGAQAWANPADAGFIKITTSGLMVDSTPASTAVGKEVVRCVTKPLRNSWYCFDLVDFSIEPTAYTIRHYSSWDTECLRNWVLEGSNDGVTWDPLMSHQNDASLNKKGQPHTWKIDANHARFRMFRILQTGRNSNGNYYLACSGFEIYGKLFADVPDHNAPSARQLDMEELKGVKFDEFVYKSDFDENGIIWHMGTKLAKSRTWVNPADVGLIEVTTSGLATNPPSVPANNALGRVVSRCVTLSKPNMWFAFDFKGRRIQPTHYTMRHYNSWDLEALRNWRFEGSNDGRRWFTLKNHTDDPGLDKKGATHTWELDESARRGAFSHFRIFQTGKNSNNHYYLALAGFELYGKLYEVPETKPDQAGVVSLKYQYDFDSNGLFYWIGSSGKRDPWKNPADAGLVKVTSSALAVSPPSVSANALCGRATVRCVSLPKPNQWFCVDLLHRRIQPTHYTLRHYSSWDTEALRSWRFEGSNDGRTWDVLRAHYNDAALNKKGATHTWAINDANQPYRLLRIVQTGVNSNNNHYLSCSGLEVYGKLFESGGRMSVATPPILQAQPSMAGGMAASSPRVGMSMSGAQGGLAAQPPPVPPPAQMAVAGPPPTPPLQAALSQQQLVPAGQQPAILSQMSGLATVNPPNKNFKDGMEFKYETDFDEKGIVWFIGTQQYTQPWRNPGQFGDVRVWSSPLATNPPSEPAWAWIGRQTVRCVTLPGRESHFGIDFLRYWVRPTAYSLRHYSSWDTEALREWKLQGSNDGKKWTKLLSHKKDTALNKKGGAHTWVIPKTKKTYRMFRILQTGKNSNGHWYCALSGFEIYGKLYSYRK